MGVVDDLLQARAAYDRQDWLAAYGGLSDAGADQLTADDFVRLATAAYLVGRRNDCVQALQRAHQLHLDAGAGLAAVRAAVAMGLNSRGRILLYGGRVPEGLALLDEAMVGVAAGEVSTIFAGTVYCSMIEACQEISDFDRAARWTAAL